MPELRFTYLGNPIIVQYDAPIVDELRAKGATFKAQRLRSGKMSVMVHFNGPVTLSLARYILGIHKDSPLRVVYLDGDPYNLCSDNLIAVSERELKTRNLIQNQRPPAVSVKRQMEAEDRRRAEYWRNAIAADIGTDVLAQWIAAHLPADTAIDR